MTMFVTETLPLGSKISRHFLHLTVLFSLSTTSKQSQTKCIKQLMADWVKNNRTPLVEMAKDGCARLIEVVA